MIDDLLALADDLAKRETGRPKQASLRRAVGTAYYAVFHALAKMCADQLVGTTKPWDVYTPIYRAINHAAARKVFSSVRKDHGDGAAVAAIGVTFSSLHEKRLEADYDPEPFSHTRQEVKDLIQEARNAIEAINSLPPETKLRLAVQFVTKTR